MHPTAMLRAELRKRHAEFEKNPSDGFQARRVATVLDIYIMSNMLVDHAIDGHTTNTFTIS